MELVSQVDYSTLESRYFYVNPAFPDSRLSPVFNDSALALQWRGRVGQENFGDYQALLEQYQSIIDGSRVVLPVSHAHAHAMIQAANLYLRDNL